MKRKSRLALASKGTTTGPPWPPARTDSLVREHVAPDLATMGGFQWAFGVGALLSLVVLALAVLMPGRAGTPHPGEAVVVLSDGEAIDPHLTHQDVGC